MRTFADHLIDLGFRETGFSRENAQYGRTCQIHSFEGRAYFRSPKEDLKNIKQFWVPAVHACTGHYFKFSKKLAHLESQRLPGVSGRLFEAGFAFFRDKKPLLFQNLIHADLSIEDVQQIDFERTFKVAAVDDKKSIFLAEWYQTIAEFELFTFSYCDLMEPEEY